MTHREKYNRTKKGLLSAIYDGQKGSSKTRGHNPPSYTKEWLAEWLFNQPNFKLLYSEWEASNYLKDLKPSVDRINDDLGYLETNIQLMTSKQNEDKQNDKQRTGCIYFSNYHEAYIARVQIAGKVTSIKQSKNKEVCEKALEQLNNKEDGIK